MAETFPVDENSGNACVKAAEEIEFCVEQLQWIDCALAPFGEPTMGAHREFQHRGGRSNHRSEFQRQIVVLNGLFHPKQPKPPAIDQGFCTTGRSVNPSEPRAFQRSNLRAAAVSGPLELGVQLHQMSQMPGFWGDLFTWCLSPWCLFLFFPPNVGDAGFF